MPELGDLRERKEAKREREGLFAASSVERLARRLAEVWDRAHVRCERQDLDAKEC